MQTICEQDDFFGDYLLYIRRTNNCYMLYNRARISGKVHKGIFSERVSMWMSKQKSSYARHTCVPDWLVSVQINNCLYVEAYFAIIEGLHEGDNLSFYGMEKRARRWSRTAIPVGYWKVRVSVYLASWYSPQMLHSDRKGVLNQISVAVLTFTLCQVISVLYLHQPSRPTGTDPAAIPPPISG